MAANWFLKLKPQSIEAAVVQVKQWGIVTKGIHSDEIMDDQDSSI